MRGWKGNIKDIDAFLNQPLSETEFEFQISHKSGHPKRFKCDVFDRNKIICVSTTNPKLIKEFLTKRGHNYDELKRI